MKTLFLATTNKGKIREFVSALPEYRIVTLLDYPEIEDIEETGKTYQENALIKARAIYEQFKIPVVSEDSGIEVFSLYGTKYGVDMAVPGIYSARFASDHNESDNNTELLKSLEQYPFDNKLLGNNLNREGKFVSTLCYIDSDGQEHFFTGETYGVISDTPKGVDGFAYDYIFQPLIKDHVFSDKTYAELTIEEKEETSHRVKSVNQLLAYIK